MLIDCTTCVARHVACADCIVTVLLAQPAPPFAVGPALGLTVGLAADLDTGSSPIDLDQDERDAIDTLAGAGLVPPLRLVRAMPDMSGHIRHSA